MNESNAMQPGQPGIHPSNPQPPFGQAAKQSASGAAIAGLILGIISLLTSFLPITNNVSFVFAIIGLILSLVGLVGIWKGKRSGKGIAVAGIVLAIVSVIIVLVTQMLFAATLDAVNAELQAGSTPTAVSAESNGASSDASSSSSDASSSQTDADYQNLAVGQTVALKDGLSVTVNSIEGGLTKHDGSEVVCVNVTYVNESTKNASFNPYDWKAEDANGAQRSQTFVLESDDKLGSGELSKGGTVTGNVYFEAPVSKVHYYGTLFDSASTAAWVAS